MFCGKHVRVFYFLFINQFFSIKKKEEASLYQKKSFLCRYSEEKDLFIGFP